MFPYGLFETKVNVVADGPVRKAARASLTTPRFNHIIRPILPGVPAFGSITQVGAVAQLGERHVRNVEVVGSIPIGSTISLKTTAPLGRFFCG